MPRIDMQRDPFSVYITEHQGNFCKFIFKYVTRTRVHNMASNQLLLRYLNNSANFKIFNKRDTREDGEINRMGTTKNGELGNRRNKRREHPRREVI